MILLLVLVVAVVLSVTVRDVVRRRDLHVGRRVAWALSTLLLPLFAIPVYWLVKPLPRPSVAVPRSPAVRVQTMADLIPGWAPDLPGACEQANAWAGSQSRVAPEPSFYSWLRQSGIAERYPACAARLLRTLLGTERRLSSLACPEIGALTRLLERYVMDGDDLRAVREQLRRLCPGMAPADPGGAERSAHRALG